MKRLLQLLIMLVVVGVGLAFGSINKMPVTVDYFLFSVEWPLALSLVVFFFVGILVGGIVTYLGTWWAVRRQIRRAKAQAATAEKVSSQPALPVSAADGND